MTCKQSTICKLGFLGDIYTLKYQTNTMKNVMIIENNHSPLSLHEEFVTAANKRAYLLGGIFTEFGVKNRNERVYTAERFLPCLAELNQRITDLGVYGEFDHPDVFDTSLQRASHLVKEAVYNKDLNRIEGKIQLLSTYWGKEARALVEDNCPVFVSSRAAGVTENDGTVSLKKLFTYDIVADPGFGSAKMSSINESLGFSSNENTNFRIYDMSDESKINDIFNMNQNDLVTKVQLAQYSDYLVKEIEDIKKTVTEAIKGAKMEPKELDKLLEYYEGLQSTNTQMVKYLDYLAERVQIVVNDNKNLREISERLITYNDYIAENLEQSINYSEDLAKNLDRTIQYTEYVAGKLDETIDYTGYIVENVDRAIAYGEYIAENLDKAIAYSEYIVENVDNSIAYVEYLTEHVEGSIAYSEYIAENLDSAIGYSDYISENLDKAISYAGLISEKLNGSKVNESNSDLIPTLEEWGFEDEDNTDVLEEEPVTQVIDQNIVGAEINPISSNEPVDLTSSTINEPSIDAAATDDTIISEPAITDVVEPTVNGIEGETDTQIEEPNSLTEEPTIGDNVISDTDASITPEVTDSTLTPATEPTTEPATEPTQAFFGESDTELSISIDKLIKETSKRKIVESNDLHFLKFLNKAQVEGYYSLTNEEQDLVKLHVNNKSYFNATDVLKMIQEALSVKNETTENRVVRLMPDAVKSIWENLNESAKRSILSQAKLYPNLTNESAVEHFWYTRNLNKTETTSKKLVSHDSLIQEDKLSDSQVNAIMEKFKSLK